MICFQVNGIYEIRNRPNISLAGQEIYPDSIFSSFQVLKVLTHSFFQLSKFLFFFCFSEIYIQNMYINHYSIFYFIHYIYWMGVCVCVCVCVCVGGEGIIFSFSRGSTKNHTVKTPNCVTKTISVTTTTMDKNYKYVLIIIVIGIVIISTAISQTGGRLALHRIRDYLK